MVTVDNFLKHICELYNSLGIEIVNLDEQYYEYDENGQIKFDEKGNVIEIKNVNVEMTKEELNAFLDRIYYFLQDIKHPLLDENKRMMIEEPELKWVPEDYEYQ